MLAAIGTTVDSADTTPFQCNENAPLFKEAILLRDEAARLLGYPDHASFRIEEKMAKTPKTVLDFLGDLKTRLAPGGAKEIDHLLALKKKDHEARNLPFDGNYYLWDHRFYDRMMVEQEYSIDENAIAEYFPLKSTVAGMLRIFEELFGLVFVELTPEDRKRISSTGKAEDIAWHDDVIIFSVWDDSSEGGGFVGYLYLDLHPRPGKYGHAANFSLQPGFLKADGTRRYPATALVCNFSKPTDKKPSLLKHDEVVTLFHELGHGIHDLAGRTRYARYHGTSTVRDFVEAPSQMLENWCWTPSQLRSLSNHYESGEPIPDDLIEKLVSTKHVNDGLFNLRQLHFGLFDMTVHSPKTHEELEQLDVSKLYNELRVQLSQIKGPEAQGEPRYVFFCHFPSATQPPATRSNILHLCQHLGQRPSNLRPPDRRLRCRLLRLPVLAGLLDRHVLLGVQEQPDGPRAGPPVPAHGAREGRVAGRDAHPRAVPRPQAQLRGVLPGAGAFELRRRGTAHAGWVVCRNMCHEERGGVVCTWLPIDPSCGVKQSSVYQLDVARNTLPPENETDKPPACMHVSSQSQESHQTNPKIQSPQHKSKYRYQKNRA